MTIPGLKIIFMEHVAKDIFVNMTKDIGQIMETRANYFLVGSFVLIGFLTIIIFLVWLSKSDFGDSIQTYNIYFKGTVTGLKKGAGVQYRGVPIGIVKDIRIKPKDVETICVQVGIESQVKLREDVTASLEIQGLTGLAFIQIKGGTNQGKILTAKPGESYPVIPAKSSLLEEVAVSLPEILAATTKLVNKAQDVLSDVNIDSLKKAFQNIEDITTYLSPKNKKDNIFEDIRQSSNSFGQAMIEFKGLVKENRSSINVGFDSMSKFLNEGREAMSAIKRISESLERSPSRFLYNDPKQGVRP